MGILPEIFEKPVVGVGFIGDTALVHPKHADLEVEEKETTKKDPEKLPE